MEAQKISNLFNRSKQLQQIWYVINSESKGNYSHENPINFLASSLESSLRDSSDAYVLVYRK